MTNDQKRYCRYYAEHSQLTALQIVKIVGCSIQTARKYIKLFRREQSK